MDVRPVDPRDIEIEVNDPTYRVYFRQPGGRSTEYELTGATDFAEVLAWAEETAPPGETFVVYACVDETLVRLHDRDPAR